MSDLKLEIITPEKIVASFMCTKLIAEGTEGQLIIYPGHTRFITGLRIGELIVQAAKGSSDKIKHRETKMNYFVAGGYLYAQDNVVKIFTPSSEKTADIDIDRAKVAKEKAERLLKEKSETTDLMRADFALERALKRLILAGKQTEK